MCFYEPTADDLSNCINFKQRNLIVKKIKKMHEGSTAMEE